MVGCAWFIGTGPIIPLVFRSGPSEIGRRDRRSRTSCHQCADTALGQEGVLGPQQAVNHFVEVILPGEEMGLSLVLEMFVAVLLDSDGQGDLPLKVLCGPSQAGQMGI